MAVEPSRASSPAASLDDVRRVLLSGRASAAETRALAEQARIPTFDANALADPRRVAYDLLKTKMPHVLKHFFQTYEAARAWNQLYRNSSEGLAKEVFNAQQRGSRKRFAIRAAAKCEKYDNCYHVVQPKAFSKLGVRQGIPIEYPGTLGRLAVEVNSVDVVSFLDELRNSSAHGSRDGPGSVWHSSTAQDVPSRVHCAFDVNKTPAQALVSKGSIYVSDSDRIANLLGELSEHIQRKGIDDTVSLNQHEFEWIKTLSWDLRISTCGLFSAPHWDSADRYVVLLFGYKRYLLVPPEFCGAVGLERENTHPFFRHTAEDWTRATRSDELDHACVGSAAERQCLPAYTAVIGPGDVLRIPPGWTHAMLSLTETHQVNAAFTGFPSAKPSFWPVRDRAWVSNNVNLYWKERCLSEPPTNEGEWRYYKFDSRTERDFGVSTSRMQYVNKELHDDALFGDESIAFIISSISSFASICMVLGYMVIRIRTKYIRRGRL